MNSRRDFLKLSVTLSAWAAGAVQARGAMVRSGEAAATDALPGIFKVIGDARHQASVAFVETARGQGLVGHLLPRGDVSRFWYQELQLTWQRSAVAVAGLTEEGPLFCLEQLGAQYGLRVMQREPVTTAEGGKLVAWLIAPRIG